MSESYELSYGEVLKELRIYHGYKQKEISEFLNITSQAYSNYENNNGYVVVDTGAGGYAPLEFDDLVCVGYDDDNLTYMYDVRIKDIEIFDSEPESEDAFFNVEVTLVRNGDLLVIDNIE